MLAISNRELIEDIFTNNYNPDKKNPKILDKQGNKKRCSEGNSIPKLDKPTRLSYKVIRNKMKTKEGGLSETARDCTLDDFVPHRPNKPLKFACNYCFQGNDT
jgi:hypothetical protein